MRDVSAAQAYLDERAGIREHDGGQSRAAAEVAAADELVKAPNIEADDKTRVLMHEPITHEQKVAGLGRLMANLRTRGERETMYWRLVRRHGKEIANEVREAQRQVMQERRPR